MYHKITNDIQDEIDHIIDNYTQSVIGTLNYNGYPMTSKVTPIKYEGEIYLLMSTLSEHTRNIEGVSAKSSLYFTEDDTHSNAMNNPRLTLTGESKRVTLDPETLEIIRDIFDNKTPGAKMYAQFGDFHIYHFEIKSTLYIKGFGKAYAS